MSREDVDGMGFDGRLGFSAVLSQSKFCTGEPADLLSLDAASRAYCARR